MVLRIGIAVSILACFTGCSNDQGLHSKIIEEHQVGFVHVSAVDVDSPVSDPCGFVKSFDKRTARLNQVIVGTGESIKNYFRGHYLNDVPIEGLWQERERLRRQQLVGSIALGMSTRSRHSCTSADSTRGFSIVAKPLVASDIVPTLTLAIADSIHIVFLVVPHTNKFEMFTTADSTISTPDALALTSEMTSFLGLHSEQLSVFFSRRSTYFFASTFPVYNPLFDPGPISLEDARRSRFVVCNSSRCNGSI